MSTFNAPAFAAVTLERKSLADALKVLAKVVEKRNTIPVCATVRIAVDAGGAVQVLGTDLDIELSVTLAGDDVAPGAFLVDCHALKGTLAKMKGGRVRIADGGAVVTLTDCTNGATLRLTNLCERDALAEFPRIAEAPTHAGMTLAAVQVRDDFGRCLAAVSFEETRYYLNGIYCHLTKDDAAVPVLRMATTDGHRLVRVTRAVPADIGGNLVQDKDGVILPRKAAGLMRDIIGTKPAGDVALAFTAAKFAFAHGNVTMTGKLIDGTFPDYARVIPSARARGVDIGRKALADTVAAVTAHCTEKLACVTIGADASGWFTAAGCDAESGIAGVELQGVQVHAPATANGSTGLETGFAGKYVLDMANKVFADVDTISIRFEDSAAPAAFYSAAAPHVLGVQMPKRGAAALNPAGVRALNPAAAPLEPVAAPAHVQEPAPATDPAPVDVSAPGDVPAAVSEPAAPVQAEPVQVQADEPAAPVDDTAAAPAAGKAPRKFADWVYDESCHYAAGRGAFTEGKARALPSYFTTAHGQNPRDWFRGYDDGASEALAAAPVQVAEPVQVDDVPGAPLTADGAARLVLADAEAIAALEAAGVTLPTSAGADYIWPQYVTTYLNLHSANAWTWAGLGKQRDRKARNRGLVLVSLETREFLYARFTALAPFQVQAAAAPADAIAAPCPADVQASATVAEFEAACPVVTPCPSDEAAPVQVQEPDALAALAARVQVLERAAGITTARPPRTAAHVRAIRAYLRMRAERGAARADAVQARTNEAAVRERVQVQARDAMRLQEYVDAMRSDVVLAETATFHANAALEATATDLRDARAALASVQGELTVERAELARLAPVVAALAALNRPALAVAA
jgi:DNA polymerase-3 subunit beta